ncbi:hypothetical protein DC083_01160 [Ignatzschineria ureiclastica]|uniref:SD-repeat containing protein B domain-containing protein n=1 Tax=Ignatzschineria ureiclastica TaxID=472582 RepID=A0A2U2AGQ7_9GAMM|nr:hypothetical protein [Ignatzschineria ureiclastica]PWD81832.1 hypothetical protein DC083_01160 [Ignatzschineria ureiclastica]GGZ90797.1 hypothetical protein GCM10007162_02230 [Ignatzschineria ureiclastica]
MSFKYYEDRQNWPAVNPGYANVSHYIFHDLNRNGIYDIGDRPLIQIAVRMTREDGSWAVRRSNLNGFVNFNNSIVDPHSEVAKKVEVRAPGVYTFEVILPDGWMVTTGNAIQKITYVEKPNTRPGIVCDNVPEPIGLAQILTISGAVLLKGEDGFTRKDDIKAVKITAIAPNKEKIEIPLNADGEYSFEGYQGQWQLEYRYGSEVQQRIFELQTAPIKVSNVVFGAGSQAVPHKPQKVLVDFENITDRNVQKMPNGVGSLKWRNLNVIHYAFEGEGYSNGTISGEYVAYNTSGYPVFIEKEEGFDFYGAYFTAAWLNSAQGETLHVEAWRGGELIAKDAFKLSALGPFWLDADYRNITRLVLSTEHYWQFVVDDMKFGV